MPVGRRRGLVVRHHAVDAADAPQQADQPRPASHDDSRPAFGHQRRVAGVLDNVAQSLLAVEQDRLPGEVLSLPLASGGTLRAPVDAQHRTIAIGPSYGPAPRQEVGTATREPCVVMVWVDRERPAAALQAFVEAALSDQALSQRGKQRWRVGLPRQSRAHLLLVFFVVPQPAQHIVQMPAQVG